MSWTPRFAPVLAESVTAVGDTAFILNAAGDIHYYDINAQQWFPDAGPSNAPVVEIGAGVDGSLVAVTSDGILHIREGGTWSTASFASAVTNGTGGGGEDFVFRDAYGAIKKRINGITSDLSSTGGPIKLSATAGNADIWGVDGDGNVMTWSNGWVVIPGKLLKQVDVSVSSSTLKVVGVDTTGLAWRLLYDGSWSPIAHTVFRGKFKWVEANGGYLWAVFADGTVHTQLI